MRILYLCPDPGVRVDAAGGAGSHVLETVRALRNPGHEVRLLAADGGVPADDGLRTPRHRWFSGLLSRMGRDADSPRSATKGDAPPPVSRGRDRFDSPTSAPAAMASAASVASETSPASTPGEGREGFRARLSGFLYGPFRRRLDLLEERTAYRRRFFRDAVEQIRDFRPDGVYERYALGHHAVAAYCERAGISHILEVNALLAEERARHEGETGFRARRRARTEREFLGRCPRVFAVSEALKRAIGSDDARVTVLPNGVDAEAFRPDIDPVPVRERYGLIGAPTVGWIGGFGPSRGLEAVLAIAERVQRRRPEVRFLVAGDGPLMPRVRERLRQDGTENVVRLTGRVARSEVPALVAAFDVALAPYPAEGAAYFSPLKIFEYMAAGRAILATDAGQSAELLAGGAGVLLAPEPIDDWADRIATLLDDPEERRRMGAAARERVGRDHTWEANARRILAAFASASSGMSRP
jgi:glycosyltransferase involved in cell wall biosynthesis